MAKSPKGSDYDRMRRRRNRQMRKLHGKPLQPSSTPFAQYGAGRIAQATEKAGSGGSGIPFDPTMLIYFLILVAFAVMVSAAFMGFGAND